MAGTVVATDAALAAIERLTASHGKLMFFVSGGCCDGSSPICLPDGELIVGPNDLCLGEVGGAPVYIDAEQYRRWRRPDLLVDVAPGGAGGISLESRAGLHFVIGSPGAPGAVSRPSLAGGEGRQPPPGSC
jgi:uncharacterized protein